MALMSSQLVESYRKYPRRIATVFINSIVFTTVGKGFKVFTMARVRSKAEVVNDSGRKLPKVLPKGLQECLLIL